MHENYNLKNIRGYCYKYGLIWVGWIVIQQEKKAVLYADNKPYMELEPEINIRYLTLGLGYDRVMKRLKNAAIKITSEKEL